MLIRNALATILLLLVVAACDSAPFAPAPRIIEGLGVEFQAQPGPAGFDQDATLERIRLEYGVGLDRAPDAVTFGMATCIDPGCFGDAGEGPLHVWLIEWKAPGTAAGTLLVDAATGALLRYE